MGILFKLFGIISIVYQFCQVFAVSGVVETVNFQCEEGWIRDGGHCYMLEGDPTAFSNAQSSCKRLGAEMVKIRDETENRFIYKLARDNSWKNVWILNSMICKAFGLFDLFEPKSENLKSLKEDVECLALNEHGKWEVAHCLENHQYICRTTACIEDGYRCHDDTGCISKKWVCDGERDCEMSGSDEQNCPSQCRFEETGISGEIDVTTSNHYKDNANCMWTITGPVGKQIKISVENFNTEEHRDYVYIYDHVSNRDIAMLSGQQSNQDFYTAAFQARIEFKTDSSTVKSGFKIKWTSDIPELNSGVTTLTASTDWQELASPFYPKSPRSFYREWLIKTDPGQIIAIQLEEFIKVMELNAMTELYIYDGETFDKTPISIKSEENSLKYLHIPFISYSNVLRVIMNFNATSPPGATGFKLLYKKGCNFNLPRTDGKIYSPGYILNEYPPSTTCTWLITDPLNTNRPYTIDIEELQLADMIDNVMIFDGESKTNSHHPSGGYKSGDTGVRITTGNQFYLTFTSNLIQSQGRFQIDYSLGCVQIPSKVYMKKSTNETTPGTEVKISCDEGYSFAQAEFNSKPEITFNCSNGGNWNYDVFPSCQVTYCGVPPAIPNGFISNYTDNVMFGDKVEYTCYDGFKMNAVSPWATCQASGSYSEGISCEASTCVSVPQLANGMSNNTGIDFASIVTYWCDDGYDLMGSVKLVCLTNGNWSHSAPRCDKKKCDVPSFKMAKTDTSGSVEFEDKVTYTCENGYEINGTAEITCGPDQKFDADVMCVDTDECATAGKCGDNFDCTNIVGSYICQCKPGYELQNSQCRDINECSDNNGGCDQDCNNSEGGYTCVCNEGYTLFTEDGINNNFKSDKETGLKAGDVLRFDHSCVGNICPRPTDIIHGKLLSKRQNFTFQEKVRYRCDLGFVAEGNLEVECDSDNTWTALPSCKSASCPMLVLKGSEKSKELVSTYYGTHDETTNVGESVIIECGLNDGSKVNKTLHCGYNVTGESYSLLGDEPQCPIIDCGPLLQIPGVKDPGVSDTFIGQKFMFECADTFTRRGTSSETSVSYEVVCDSNGRWRYGNLTCSGDSCSDPGTPANAEQITKGYGLGQTIKYRCMREGYSPVPDVTLTCVNEMGLKWDNLVPYCTDTTAPEFTECPSSPIMVKPLEEITVMIPTATDNSGLVTMIVSENIGVKVRLVEDKNITYTASDGATNHVVCTVQYKVITDGEKPTLDCPDFLTLSVNDSTIKVKDLQEEITSDGELTITPASIEYSTSTIGKVIPVTVIATGDQGQTSQCTFSVEVQADACFQDTLVPLVNADRNCEGTSSSLTCTSMCKPGVYFKDGKKESTSSCTGAAEWTGDPNKDCIVSKTPVYSYSVNIRYKFESLFENCQVSFQSEFNNELTKSSSLLNKACRKSFTENYQFAVEDLVVLPIPGLFFQGEVTVDLRVKDTELEQDRLTDCTDELYKYNSSIFDVDNSDCGSGDVEKFTIVQFGNTCREEGYSLVNTIDSTVVCLACDSGTFYNSTSKSCEECSTGEYQDLTNQKSCKKCVNADTSSMPRRLQSDCIANCAEGFVRNNGHCEACPVDTYKMDESTCSVCPNSGSTNGVEGVNSQSGCNEPCQPGYYSATGFEDCVVCPKHFYSGAGAKTCTECDSDEITTISGIVSNDNCTKSTECDSDPCGDHGSCTYSYHQAVCTCEEGYTGRFCNEVIDNCQSNPCWNGGTCTSSTSGFTCECLVEQKCTMNIEGEYTLEKGELNRTQVNDSPACSTSCLDNKDCYYSVFVNGFCFLYGKDVGDSQKDAPGYTLSKKICNDTYYFIGDQCETDNVNNCKDDPCSEFGYCQDKIDTFSCLCISSSYEPPRCESKADLCDNYCSEHGKCETFGSVRALCICDADYTGEKCETEIKQCDENPDGCLYNGMCVETPGIPGYSCQCKTGYTGDHCETVSPLCQASSCTNGLCYDDHDRQAPICVCEDLFTNENGECKYKNDCLDFGCHHNGTCTSTEGKASCVCGEDYDGSICQHETDECLSKPCMNDGICTDLPIDQYNCTCLSGFEGKNCETNIDDRACNADNTESSQDRVNDFICHCKPGFKGKDCSESIDECESFPCQHGGTCADKVNDYVCSCTQGWEGKNCEQSVNYCNDTVCNDGTCVSLIDQYFCRCSVGVTGVNCEQSPKVCDKISPCTSNGNCKNTGGTAVCECNEGYDGKSCELMSGDPCKDVQCDRGTCNKGVCECPDNYKGTKCDSLIDPCSPLNCPSATTCLNPNFPDIQPKCMCPDHKVRSDSTCKDTIVNYDIFVNSKTPQYIAPTSEYFYINKTYGLSIILWTASLVGENLGTVFSIQNPDKINIFSLTPMSFSASDVLHPLDADFNLNNKKWNHIAVKISPTGKVDVMVNGIGQNTKLTLELPKHARLQIGKDFVGYVSRLRLWNRILETSEILTTYNYPDGIMDTDLIFNWQDMPYSQHQTRVTPSRLQNNSGPIYLCEYGIFNERCNKKINKSPPTTDSCDPSKIMEQRTETRKRSTLIQDLISPPKFSGGMTYIMNTISNSVLSWGSHDIFYVSKDEDNNHVTCRYRAHITSPDRKCAPFTDSGGDCDVSDGTTILCSNPEHRPSIPTPMVYTCSKLGSYNGLDWRTPSLIPPCGAVGTVQMTVTAVIPYTMGIGCNTQIESTMQKQVEQKLKDLNMKWSGLCDDDSCSNIEVTVRCKVRERRDTDTPDSQRLTATFTAQSLPSKLEGENNVKLSPVDVLKLSILDSDNFDFPDIAQAKVQKSAVMINGVGSCPDGQTFINNVCVQCGPGSFYNTTTKKCVVCGYGFYQTASESTSCLACTGDKTTFTLGSTEEARCIAKCEAGSYYDTPTTSCKVCERDFYQPEEGKDLCLPCHLSKRTRGNGTKEVSECVDDCADGYEISATDPGECDICKQDHYRTASIDDKCMLCPDNMVALQEGAKSSDECKYPSCEQGTYIVENNCSSCPYGQYQDEKWKTSCKKCPENTSTRQLGSTSDDQCEFACFGGYEQKNSSVKECTPCERGYYKSGDGDNFLMCKQCEDMTKTTVGIGSTSSDDCNITICLAGSRRDPDSNKCSDCPVGFYQEKDLQDSCVKCQDDYTTVSTGSDNSSKCLFYCGAGQEKKSDENACEMCPRGKYKSNTNLLGKCQDCEAGKTTDSTGSTSDSDCSLPICGRGEVIKEGKCDKCNRNTYQPVESPDLKNDCLPCPTDTETEDKGTTSEQDCKPFCLEGQQYNSESKTCEQCPQGTWNYGAIPARFEDCTKCREGYTTVNNGSTKAADCSLRNCPPGSKIVNNDCELCPYATYQPLYHQVDCISCSKKEENTSSTGSTSKDKCQIDCPAGKQETESSCSSCPPDTFKPSQGYDTCNPCTGDVTSDSSRISCDVPFCDSGAEVVNGACTACKKGFYKSERGNTTCQACPSSYTTSATGSKAPESCDQLYCEEGFYQKESACEPCSVGTYNNLKGQTECNDCPTGKTTSSTGSNSDAQCSLVYCDAGQYRESDLVCTNCTYGQYQNMSGSTTCEKCPDVTNTTDTGSISIDQCLVICTSGQYRNDDNVCVDCDKGYYQPDVFKESCEKCPDDFTTDTTGSKSEQDCKIICPVGEYRKETDRDVCTPCDKNTYQDQPGQTTCKSCGDGKATKDIRSTADTDCLQLCEPGEYLDSTTCKKCPSGQYSTTGGLNTQCTPCETGKTTTNTGSTASSDCNLRACQRGEEVKADECVPCPLGKYQDETAMPACKDCPSGLTTLITGGTGEKLCVDDCNDGFEYIVKNKQCEMCPIDYYKDDTLVTCVKCPRGQTTTTTGSTSCVASTVPEDPTASVARTTFTMVTEFSINPDSCSNTPQLRGLIELILLESFRAQARLYEGLCSEVACGNIQTRILLCGTTARRRKRGVNGNIKAEATTTAENVPIEVASSNNTRNTERVLEEALYSITSSDKRLMSYGVQFDAIKAITKTEACKEGQIQKNGACVDCPAGTYYDKVKFECIKCERGYYQPSTKQISCMKCSGNDTTAAIESKSESDCVSLCKLNTGFCLNGGTCKMNEDGMMDCECTESYEGDTCEMRKENASSLGPILGGAVGGGATLLVLILVIVGCCVHLKNTKPKKKLRGEMMFPSNEKDYFYPYGSQSSVGNYGNPVKPFPNMAMPNPMYLDYRDNWDDNDHAAFYDARSDGQRRTPRSNDA